MKLHDLRKQYKLHTLDEVSTPADPLELFTLWFKQALSVHPYEANAFTLSTVQDNRPSARVVLLKEFSSQGFVFFTNYKSRKARALEVNAYAAMNFYWPDMERQIRIEGRVERTTKEVSAAYFFQRPLESRINAVISPQSTKISSKDQLIRQHNQMLKQQTEPDLPGYWGGYVVVADYYEFWQGGPNRLHDRIIYEKCDTENWLKSRLAP